MQQPTDRSVIGGRVADNVLCRACKYDLRQQPIDGQCPECGELIVRTVERERLVMADPDWLATLARGARWLKWASWLLLYVPIFTFLLGIGFVLTTFFSLPGWIGTALGIIATAVFWAVMISMLCLPMAGLLAAIIACYWIGAPEPEQGPASWRQVLARIMIPLSLMMLPLYFWQDLWAGTPEAQPVYLGSIIGCAMLAFYASASLLADALARIPDFKLANSVRSMSRWIPLAVTVVALTASQIDYSPAGALADEGILEIVHACALFALLPGFFIWVGTMPAVSRALTDVAEEAQQMAKRSPSADQSGRASV